MFILLYLYGICILLLYLYCWVTRYDERRRNTNTLLIPADRYILTRIYIYTPEYVHHIYDTIHVQHPVYVEMPVQSSPIHCSSGSSSTWYI